MKTTFKRSFARDLRNIRERTLLTQIQSAIEAIENAETLFDLSQVKRLQGAEGYYRIRIGNYRIGLTYDGETVTFVRCLHRRDLYRYFP